MNQSQLSKKIAVLSMFTFLCFFGYFSKALASAFPSEGTYRGLIKTKKGESIPLRFDLSYSDTLTQAPSDDLFPMKRAITVSAYIDNDGGPYNLGQANFNLETGKFELLYSRPNMVNPTLKFQGNLVSDNEIKGHLVSGLRGELGTFDVIKDSQVGAATHSRYAGEYEGTITWTLDNQTVPLQIKIHPNTLTSTNPSDFELDFTTGYAGGTVMKSWDAPIQTIAIDYFTHTIYLTHHELTGATFTLIGQVTANGQISGFMNSSLQGHTATFTAQRTTP